MKIAPDQWSQLRRAAFDDDRKRFEALIEQIVLQRIREDQAVRQASTPFMDGRPFLASCR